MPPRSIKPARVARTISSHPPSCSRSYATIIDSPALSATAPAPAIQLFPRTQPPSHKPPELRKSQLIRSYASLLRSCPLLLFFQHNNIKATEWIGIRRELVIALRKADAQRAGEGLSTPGEEGLADHIKIQIIQASLFGVALKTVEYFQMRPELGAEDRAIDTLAQGDKAQSKRPRATPSNKGGGTPPKHTHVLSPDAHHAVKIARRKHALEPLLSGPIVLLSLPRVSPLHLKAALKILSPHPPDFAAPTRKASPGWHDPAVQAGVAKLMLMGARVDGKVIDLARTRFVGGIEGGLEGERARLVHVLQGASMSVASTLEGAGRSLYMTLEGRKMALEDAQKGDAEARATDAAPAA